MEQSNFAHLHVHSEYSLLDGSAKIKELVARTKELGMDSIALTDHGNMFGVIDFYKIAKNNGIKPILGCEVYVANKSLQQKNADKENYYNHLILLAENNEGYHNLVKLVSIGYVDGFYYRPRVDKETLRKYSKGLIALSACLAGPINRKLLRYTYEDALNEALEYNEIFGDGNFFIELQNHGLPEQLETNKSLIKISEETGIPLVATNDTHYIYETDVKPHEVLLCIQTGKTMLDDDRLIYEGGQFYLKSEDEMRELFKNNIDAINNTKTIADRCNVEIKFNEYKLPKYNQPEGYTSLEYLNHVTMEGINRKYKEVTPEILDRVNFEIDTISSMGFVDYFLVVWDFIKYAKDNDIMVGPGRGSAAGSIIAYALDITTIDPLKYNLIFERFLNPERVSMPDIDIDFCYERREEVIQYVVEKYGQDHVAQIITFGTLGAKAAIRDVGRALAIPYAEVDKIAKMIPFEIGMNITKALKMSTELNNLYKTDETVHELIDMALRLEGLPRHSSTHAAGVIIADKPITEYVPVSQSDGNINTQYTMSTLEELGLLKMDFLGLRTLTVIQNAVTEIEKNYGIKIDIENIDFEEKEVYDLIARGNTEGVFQLESSGMKSFMKELKPDCLEDVIAGISLYRPGPMDFIPKYVKGKFSNGEVEYTHEKLKPILVNTYGCIVYQEQVMEIFRELAGYSLGRSDLVRRAMSKKKIDVMEQERKIFIYGLEGEIDGCVKRGVDEKSANQIFDEMSDFAKYAFNKSHAAAYAVVGYQTAWLKYHYKVEFMAALMTSVMDSTHKITEYIVECKKMNIEILPADVNKGYGKFSVYDGKIRFGLLAMKNLGKNTVLGLIKDREENGEFKSLTDFVNRMQSKDLNKRGLESLILGGAFDSLGGKRSQYMSVYQNVLNGVSLNRKKNIEGQLNLFDISSEDDEIQYTDDLPDIVEFDKKTLLQNEKNILGVYLTGHPLDEYAKIIENLTNVSSKDLMYDEETNKLQNSNLQDNSVVTYGGLISSVSVKYTRNNNQMAFLAVEDTYGEVEIVVFPNVYEKFKDIIEKEVPVIIKGTLNVKEEETAKIICNNIFVINNELDVNNSPSSEKNTGKTLWIKINNDTNSKIVMDILQKYKGSDNVIVYNSDTKQKNKLETIYNVTTNYELLAELKYLLGESSVVVK